jgi:hypothetical protein
MPNLFQDGPVFYCQKHNFTMPSINLIMKLLPAFFTFCIIAMLFSGCKKDPPLYPSGDGVITGPGGTGTEPEVDTGIDPPVDATYTIPIGTANTIAFQVDGAEIVILTSPTAIVTPPNVKTITGYTSILAEQSTPDITFQLNFSAISAGERVNDLLGIIYKNFKLSDDGSGKVKTTTLKKIDGLYRIRGYFKVVTTDDNDGSKHTVIGSFNIAQ